MITRYIIISIISSILFGVVDSLINANPLGVAFMVLSMVFLRPSKAELRRWSVDQRHRPGPAVRARRHRDRLYCHNELLRL